MLLSDCNDKGIDYSDKNVDDDNNDNNADINKNECTSNNDRENDSNDCASNNIKNNNNKDNSNYYTSNNGVVNACSSNNIKNIYYTSNNISDSNNQDNSNDCTSNNHSANGNFVRANVNTSVSNRVAFCCFWSWSGLRRHSWKQRSVCFECASVNHGAGGCFCCAKLSSKPVFSVSFNRFVFFFFCLIAWTSAGENVVCQVNVNPSSLQTYAFSLRWSLSASGVYSVSSVASSNGVESVSAAATVSIVALVQLSLNAPPILRSGSNGPFEMSFVNNGPCIANNVTLQTTILPSGLELLRVEKKKTTKNGCLLTICLTGFSE